MIGNRRVRVNADQIEEKEIKSMKQTKEYGFKMSDEEIMVRIMLNHLK
jgi:hypothetical protein